MPRTHQRNIEARSRNDCCRGKAVNITCVLAARVCSLSYTARNAHAPHYIATVACQAVQYVSTLSNKRCNFRRGEGVGTC